MHVEETESAKSMVMITQRLSILKIASAKHKLTLLVAQRNKLTNQLTKGDRPV